MTEGDPYEPVTAPEPKTAEQRSAGRGSLLGRILGPLAVAGGVLLKVGGLLKFASIFIAIGGYALIWGWRWAVGFVALILVHELGHFFEARRQGLRPKLPVFVPFFGAYVTMQNRFDPWRNALVSLAGPIVGGIGAAVFLVVGRAEDSQLLQALAYSGFLLNLFNLLPIGFLDGGQTYRSWNVLRRGGGQARPEDARRLGNVVAAIALGTVVLLVLGMWVAHVPQDRL